MSAPPPWRVWRPGGRVTVVAAGHRSVYRVSAVVAGDGIYFADATAARLTGRSAVDLVALRTAPGARASVAAKVRAIARGRRAGRVHR